MVTLRFILTNLVYFFPKKINLNACSWCIPQVLAFKVFKEKKLAYLMKMHRSLQPHLLEKYYHLEVPFF